MFECDMHTHTVRSDGHLTPLQSMDRAAELGLKVLVISDHDTILPLFCEKNVEEYAASKGLERIPESWENAAFLTNIIISM